MLLVHPPSPLCLFPTAFVDHHASRFAHGRTIAARLSPSGSDGFRFLQQRNHCPTDFRGRSSDLYDLIGSDRIPSGVFAKRPFRTQCVLFDPWNVSESLPNPNNLARRNSRFCSTLSRLGPVTKLAREHQTVSNLSPEKRRSGRVIALGGGADPNIWRPWKASF